MTLCIVLVGCSNSSTQVLKSQEVRAMKSDSQNDPQSIKETAFNSLSLKEKDELEDKGEQGIVQRKVVTKRIAYLIDEKYDNKEVYAVTFTSKNLVLGDIVVFVDKNTGMVIGKGYRE